MTRKADVVVAGHICLDVIPQFPHSPTPQPLDLKPGTLIRVGPSLHVTGGAVANTGLALHKLGVATQLIGKVGGDPYGQRILDLLRQHDPAFIESMVVDDREATSYTIVISPPGLDRIFLHCPGANDTFGSEDIAWQHVEGARLLHFGYPPLMRRLCQNAGDQLLQIFLHAKGLGLTTSLDMAAVDVQSEAGKVDWAAWLQHVLPGVDLFLPSVEEILLMLEPHGRPHAADQVNRSLLSDLAIRLLELGVAIVAIKLGQQGLYLRTSSALDRLQALGAAAPRELRCWQSRELYSACYMAEFRGATGAGDCTIGGFLARLLSGGSPSDVVNAAVAVGACSVEATDAIGGVPHWNHVQERLDAGWQKHPPKFSCPDDWQLHRDAQVWSGPADRPA